MEKAQPFQLLSLGEVLRAAKKETFRWTPKRKAVVVEAVREGGLSANDVVERLAVSAEELASWQSQFAKHGLAGLSQWKFQALAPERRKVRARGTQMAVAPDWQARRALMRTRLG